MKRALLLLPILVASAVSQRLPLPDRSQFSLTGSQLVSVLSPLSREAREERIFKEIQEGNVPTFLRQLVPVSYTLGGKQVTVWVTPEYLALGSDADYFLMPMGGPLAQRVANLLGCSMPTKLLVDRIYTAAPLKLAPQPIAPSAEMITIPVFAQHQDLVWSVRSQQLSAHPLGTLVGGHKKDVIISHKIYSELKSTVPKPVVIYGWHQLSGVPIQPVYNGHVEWYADYSHGIRMVWDSVVVDADTLSLRSLMADPSLYTLVADAGPITMPYYTSPTGIDAGEEERPHGFRLEQNYPNPFNPSTDIRYQILGDRHVRLSVYDQVGREIARLVDGTKVAGEYLTRWDARGFPSGTYVYALQVSGTDVSPVRSARRMLLIR